MVVKVALLSGPLTIGQPVNVCDKDGVMLFPGTVKKIRHGVYISGEDESVCNVALIVARGPSPKKWKSLWVGVKTCP
jgi:hypothetical protein